MLEHVFLWTRVMARGQWGPWGALPGWDDLATFLRHQGCVPSSMQPTFRTAFFRVVNIQG